VSVRPGAYGDLVSATTRELSDREREILAFERHWWKYVGAKNQAIRDTSDSRPSGITSCSTR
jgi:hypothetical protein